MLLPAAELEGFLQALLEDFDALLEALTGVDVEKAQAWDPEDLRNILAAVVAGCGVHALNVAAAGGLRDGVTLAVQEVRRRRGRTHARCAPPLSGGRVPRARRRWRRAGPRGRRRARRCSRWRA